MASFSPLTLSIFFFFIQIICINLSHAVVPANETFKYVNQGELGQYISEYFGDYRPLDPFTSPFQLCFYNQTPTAFTLALRMGLRRTESLMRWVWEANRGNPVDENATLTFGTDGNLVLARSNGQVAWQTATANKGVVGLKILANGNMVLYDSKGKFLWQSFDTPTDTLLVGQTLKVGGATTKLVSRASADENVNGPYSLVMEPKGLHLYYKPTKSPKLIRYYSILTNLKKGESLQNVTFEFENENDQGFAFLLNLIYGISNSTGDRTILNRIKYNTTLSFLRLEIDGNLRIYTYNDKVDYGAWEVTFTLFLKAPPPLFQVTKAELASESSECQLPKKCGNFGLCEDSQCVGCPSSSTGPVLAWSKNCEQPKLKSCAQKDFHYNKLAGVDHYMIKYTSGDGPVKDNDCGAKCTGDCKCLGYFYNQDTSRCWLAYDLSTLTRVVNATHLAYIKVPN